jgi:hypothetical protein
LNSWRVAASVIVNSAELDWEIVQNNSYLDEKVEILDSKDRVVFEHEQIIYEIFVNSEGDYEYNFYSFANVFNRNTLDTTDGGCCTGFARDAIFMAIESY